MNRKFLVALAWVSALGLAAILGQKHDPFAITLARAATTATPMSTVVDSPLPEPTAIFTTQPRRTGPTATSTPLPSPTPILPTITAVEEDEALPIPNNFIFLEDGNLRYWDVATQEIEPLVGEDGVILDTTGASIRQMSVDAQRQRLAFILARGGALEQLYVVDLSTRWSRQLVMTKRILSAEISPDGAYVAYIPLDRRMPTSAPSPFSSPMHPQGPQAGPVLVAAVETRDQPIQIGECRAVDYILDNPLDVDRGYYNCNQNSVAWSPDSRSLAWSDGRGVWLGEITGSESKLVLEHNHEGYVVSQHTYFPEQWSSQGRFLLLDVWHWEGGTYALLDTESGRVENRWDWWEWNFSAVDLTWLADGRLLVTNHLKRMDEQPDVEVPPYIELWTLATDPEAEQLLSREETIPLPVSDHIFPDSPTELADGRIALTLLNLRVESQADRGIYLLDLISQRLERVSDLPPAKIVQFAPGPFDYTVEGITTQTFVHPQGTGALFKDRGQDILLYLSFEEGKLYDLTSHIDPGACCFVWVD